MNYFHLQENDQPYESHIVFEDVKSAKPAQRSELPPNVFKYLGLLAESGLPIKSKYEPFCCKGCGRYNSDDVYAKGFFEPVNIRIKGDFSYVDRILVISERFVKVLRAAKITGWEVKPIGKQSWYGLKTTMRVDSRDEGVMIPDEPYCSDCSRPDGYRGTFTRRRELSVPKKDKTLFTTKKTFIKPFSDRELFLTEDAVMALKCGGIRGGYCKRLWTDEEVQIAEEKAKKGVKWTPPKVTVFLNGK